jgi:hypothetical protein
MGERVSSSVDQPKIETFEEALNRLNKNCVFSSDEIERAVILHESIEKMEESQKRFPPGFWDKVFSIAREVKPKSRPPRKIPSEWKINTEKVIAEMDEKRRKGDFKRIEEWHKRVTRPLPPEKRLRVIGKRRH